MPSKLTKQQLTELIEYKAKGYTDTQCAEYFQVSRQTISTWRSKLTKAGYTLPNAKSGPRPVDLTALK